MRNIFLAATTFFAMSSNLFAQSFVDVRIASATDASIAAKAEALAPSLSGDGRYLAFVSTDSELLVNDENKAEDIYIKDLQASPQTLIRISNKQGSIAASGASTAPAISRNGTHVAFVSDAADLTTQSDSNSVKDVFLYSLSSGAISLISSRSVGGFANGESFEPAISSDGAYVAFTSKASDLLISSSNEFTQIFLSNTSTSALTRITQASSVEPGNGDSGSAAISADGRYVVFASKATNLTSMPTTPEPKYNIFLYDRDAVPPTITRISQGLGGAASNGESYSPSISSDGRFITFASTASNLVDGVTDTNDDADIFLYDSMAASPQISHVTKLSSTNAKANGASSAPIISGDGAQIVFLSDATNLVNNDKNNQAADGKSDIFAFKRSDSSFRRINVNHLGFEVAGDSNAAATNTDASSFAFDYSGELDKTAKGIRQVYIVDENCSVDSDSDSTLNCADECAFDADKTAALICGCGVSDTDEDADGTPTCNDACPTDANKTYVGSCGCGASDTDANGNGAADCVDPTSSTVPEKPLSDVRGSTVAISFPAQFLGVTYKIAISRGGTVVSRKSTRKSSITFNLPAGSYKARFRVQLGNVTSKNSPFRNFKVR